MDTPIHQVFHPEPSSDTFLRSLGSVLVLVEPPVTGGWGRYKAKQRQNSWFMDTDSLNFIDIDIEEIEIHKS